MKHAERKEALDPFFVSILVPPVYLSIITSMLNLIKIVGKNGQEYEPGTKLSTCKVQYNIKIHKSNAN